MEAGLREVLANSTVFALPMATRFRGIDVREGVLLHGPSGWGEFAPFAEYNADTCALWLTSAIEAAYGSWPQIRRDRIPVNAIVPACSPQEAAALAFRAYVGDGCTTVKIKVAEAGQTLDDDIERVAAVSSAMVAASMPRPRIRIDANGAWTVEQATAAIRELDAIAGPVAGGLEYAEQPCATLEELAELRRKVSVPIAADESIRKSADPIRAVRAGAVDAIVVKAPPLGGVSLALRVAQAAGVPVIVSSAMDSSVGLNAGLALAAALDDLPYACGLGTGALLGADLTAVPLRPHGGSLPVQRAAPDPHALAAAAQSVHADRARWWRERIIGAWSAGASDLAGSWLRSR